MKQADLFDTKTMFDWLLEFGSASRGDALHQLGKGWRYNWSAARIHAAYERLISEGSVVSGISCRISPTEAGHVRYRPHYVAQSA